MPGSTTNYDFAFFDYGDQLNSVINAQLEVDRFVLIDEQIFGLYSVYGDGVLTGWTMSNANGDLSITIAPGVAIISALACETDFPVDVASLPANETVTIYASVVGTTTVNRAVQFNYTTTSLPDQCIILGSVTTSDSNVTSIDITNQQVVGFQQIINEEVATHHHTGSPTKINLPTETRGLLPGARIAPLDASVLASGQISISQISQINHNQLGNIGLLTHPQLDSIVGSIQLNNQQLLGEISSVNLMKAVVALKYNDPLVDEFFINEVAIIPGVSPSSLIDWDNTTAYVDNYSQCISGLPPDIILPNVNGDGGSQADLSIIIIHWQTDVDFSGASVISNLGIHNGVSLLSDTSQDLVLEDFETVSSGSAGGYTGILNETTSVTATYDNSTAAQGFYSGKFETQHTYSSTFTKTYTTAQNWSNYNQLVLDVKSYSASHAAVYMKIIDTSGNIITTFNLLATDEITSEGNLETGGFATKTFSLSQLPLTNVGSITVYTNNITSSDEVFWLDNILLQNVGLLLPQGTMRLRYSASTPVIFRSIDYIATIPVGTDFRVRERVGMDVQSMLAAPFSTRLTPGDVFSAVGREIEIDITFYSDQAQLQSPVLTYLELQILVQSQDSGFTIDDAAAFNEGEFENEVVTTDQAGESYVKMQYTNVGDMYFIYESIVNELNPSNVPQFGVNGGKVPISPQQAYQSLNGQQTSGFSGAVSVYRLQNANYLIADTDNDRVIETSPDGNLISGFGCHNRDYDTTTYGLTAAYNPTLGILFITFSMQIPLDSYDLTQIHLNWDSNILTLDNSSDLRTTLENVPIVYNPLATSFSLDRVLSIQLSQNHQNLLSTVTDTIYIQLDSDPNLNYITCFQGNFFYYARGAILRPVYANELTPGKWLIGNSQIFHGYDDIISGSFTAGSPPGVTISETALQDFQSMLASSTSVLSIIDDVALSQSTQSFGTEDFTYNNIMFSDITIGGIFPINDNTLLIAGIRPIPASSTTTTTSATTSNATGTNAQRLAGYQGVVIAWNKITSNISFTYESPEGLYPSDVFIDDDGFYVVAETSLIPQAGRIIRLDRFGNISDVISNGMYTQINDIRKLMNNHMLVST